MQCFHDYRRFLAKSVQVWAIDLYLSAPQPKFGPPPMQQDRLVNGQFYILIVVPYLTVPLLYSKYKSILVASANDHFSRIHRVKEISPITVLIGHYLYGIEHWTLDLLTSRLAHMGFVPSKHPARYNLLVLEYYKHFMYRANDSKLFFF